MALFEILVNGVPRMEGEEISALTLVSEEQAGRPDRVTLIAGAGTEGACAVQHLDANLKAGDEVTIRIFDEVARSAEEAALRVCSFCGSSAQEVHALLFGAQLIVCDGCVGTLGAVVESTARLPAGTRLRDGGVACGFCEKPAEKTGGVVVRNGAAICPECLRMCVDLAADVPRQS